MADVHGLTPDDAVLMPAPLAHVCGLLNGVTRARRRTDEDRADGEVGSRSGHCGSSNASASSFMIGPPTFFVGMMDARPILSAGVEIAAAGVVRRRRRHARVRRVRDAALDCGVKRTYGSTEAPTITTSHTGDDRIRAATPTAAPPVRSSYAVDPATASVLVRGPELFAGYVDPARRPRRSTGGWFRTGDLGDARRDGWLTITGA